MNDSSRSVRRAFLLMTDAQAYFEGLGFALDDRARPVGDSRDAPGGKALPGLGRSGWAKALGF